MKAARRSGRRGAEGGARGRCPQHDDAAAARWIQILMARQLGLKPCEAVAPPKSRKTMVSRVKPGELQDPAGFSALTAVSRFPRRNWCSPHGSPISGEAAFIVCEMLTLNPDSTRSSAFREGQRARGASEFST